MRKLSSESWVIIVVALAILNFFVFGIFIVLVVITAPPGGPLRIAEVDTAQPSAPTETIAVPSPTLGMVPTFTPMPATPTPLVEGTPALLETVTRSPLTEHTPTASATWTHSSTPTSIPSSTPTHTPTKTRTPTPSSTATATHTPTSTKTNTATATSTATPTRSPTPSRTPTLVVAATPSRTATPTSTRASTRTPTTTPTRTPTATHSATSTPSPTHTHTRTATPSPSHTGTSTATATATWTATATPSPTVPTATETGEAAPEIAEPPSKTSPAPPANVTGESEGGDQIDIAWDPLTNVPGTIYRVYWDMGSGYSMYSLRTSVPDAGFTDSGLRPSTTYRYLITSFDGEIESSPSGVAVETHSWLRLPLAKLTEGGGVHTVAQATATPQSTASASASAPQPSEVILGLMGTNDYVDELGQLRLIGEVHNDVLGNVDQIRVSVTFYDDAGKVLETGTASALLDLLTPGQRSPFVFVWENPGDWKRYSLRATARPTTERPKEGLTLVHSYARLDDNGLYHVVGTIKNDGLTTAYYVRVVVCLYDSFGKISNAGFAYATPSRIPPGRTASFDSLFEYYPYLAEHVVQIAHR